MNKLTREDLSLLLSQYVDGVLNEADRKVVEELIQTDKTVQEEFNQLARLKSLLADSQKIEPNIGFWTRLSTSLAEREKEEDNLLPFPRRFIPAATLSGIIGVVLIGLVLFQNRNSLIQYFSEKSQIVQSAYEQGILKGSILPLLSHIDENQVLQFSLLGILPLDAEAKTALRVDESASSGYKIKLGKTGSMKSSPLSVKDFYADIQATPVQQGVIDSLFGLARKQIESSVLVGENEAVAIDPALTQLNKVMVTNIAAFLEPPQRVRFGQYLEKRNAPYSFISRKASPMNPESIYVQMKRVPHAERFVVISPDTVAYEHVSVERIQAQRQYPRMAEQRKYEVGQNLARAENLIRHLADKEFRGVRVPSIQFQVSGDANAISIHFQPEVRGVLWEPRQQVVVPRPRREHSVSVHAPSGNVRVQYYDETISERDLIVDSVMVRFFNRPMHPRFNFDLMDSVLNSMNDHFRTETQVVSFDSLLRSLEAVRQKMSRDRDDKDQQKEGIQRDRKRYPARPIEK